MAHRSALECVNELLQAIAGKEEPFGDKIFLGISDLHQTAPSVHFASKTEIIEASIVSSPLRPSISMLCLYQSRRDLCDPEYARWFDEIGQVSVS